MPSARVLLAAVLLAGAMRAGDVSLPPVSPAFGADERWSVVGDSITHEGSYHTAIELFYLTRFPARILACRNLGLSGDTAAGAQRRVEWDILASRPTIVSVMLGMNDVGPRLYADTEVSADIALRRRARIDDYENNLRRLVARLREAGVRVVLVTPSPFDDSAELAAPRLTGVNAALGECAAAVRRVAAGSGCAVVDFHGPLTRLNLERQRTDPTFTLVSADRVHPGAAGHFVMAYHFLRAQGVAGPVARVSLDTTRLAVLTTDNGRVGHVRRLDGGVAFTWEADALPYPVTAEIAPALSWVPFEGEFNQETLQITGLAAGNYMLRIDGIEIRRYGADELARGVNLAIERTTPQYQQALTVAALLRDRAAFVAAELRGIALLEHLAAAQLPRPLTLDAMRPVVERRLAAIRKKPPVWPLFLEITERYLDRKAREQELQAEADRMELAARRAAQPLSHEYAVVPVGKRTRQE